MKGLVWNCQSVTWKYSGQEVKEAKNCLLVYICCEKSDNNRKAREASRRILQLNLKRYKRAALVLFPFAHLSSEIACQQIAQKLLSYLEDLLSKKILVTKLKFDHQKEIKIHLLPNNSDVSFFSY